MCEFSILLPLNYKSSFCLFIKWVRGLPETKVVRHEHLKFSRALDSERAERLKVFRKRIGEVISPTVTEEGVIVTIAEKRERWTDDKKIEWQDLYTRDHLHIDVQKFRDLIDGKKSAGLEITVKDAVEAYLLVWGYGSKSVIAGFLWAMSDDYPEFRVKHEEIRETVKVKPLFGPEREEVKIRRVAKTIGSVDELVNTVGQALSRLAMEGLA
jgi:hypothetical protein